MRDQFIRSFGKHLGVLTGATVIISLAIVTVAGAYHTREIHRLGNEALDRVSAELQRRIATINTDLKAVSAGVENPEDLAEALAKTGMLLEYRPYYLGLRIVEQESDQGWCIRAAVPGGNAATNRTGLAPDLEAWHPVRADRSGTPEFLGYLVLSVHHALFQEVVIDEDLRSVGRLSLIDPLGTAVYGQPLEQEVTAALSSQPVLRKGSYYSASTIGFPGMTGEWTVVSQVALTVLRTERRTELRTVVILGAVLSVGLIGVSWNLAFESTRRREYESRLRQKVREASSASRAKTSFLSNMSHELRTPMNGIVAMADLLLQQCVDDRHKDYAQLIRRSALQLLLVLETIIDYSRLDGQSLESGQTATDVSLLLREVVETYANTGSVSTKDVQIVLYADPRLPANLLANPERIRQIFVSLVDNATKYTEEGHITASLGLREDVGAAVRVVFSVEDTGCGMTEEQKLLAFAPFWQADQSDSRNFGGVGLSLASTKKLVELMGGTVSVESAPGHGSLFECTLELPKDVPVAPAPDRVPGSLKGLRVVTLGLSNDLVSVVAEYLDYWGCESQHLDENPTPYFEAPSLGRPDIIIAQGNTRGLEHVLQEGVRLVRIGEPRPGEPNAGCADDELTQPIVRETLFCVLGGMPVTRELSARDRAKITTPRKTILIADDDPMTREVVELVLRDQGYTVFSAGNGRRAVEMARRVKPDLVVMDVAMPFLSGLDATREIRRLPDNRIASVPIIVLTARVFSGSAAQAIGYGATAFLPKPAVNERLVELVEELVG